MSTFHKTVESYKQGARTMPREKYASPEVYAREQQLELVRVDRHAARLFTMTVDHGRDESRRPQLAVVSLTLSVARLGAQRCIRSHFSVSCTALN